MKKLTKRVLIVLGMILFLPVLIYGIYLHIQYPKTLLVYIPVGLIMIDQLIPDSWREKEGSDTMQGGGFF